MSTPAPQTNLFLLIPLSPSPPIFFSATSESSNDKQLTRRAKRPMASDSEHAGSQQPPGSPPQARTVNFEGMTAGTCTEDVREVADYFGEIEQLHTDRQGRGFIRFFQASAAQEFYDTLHGMGRQVCLVPDSIAPACTPPCGSDAGSTEPDPVSPSTSSLRVARPVGSTPHHFYGQSAGCGELAGGGAGADARASRDPERMLSSAPVQIYNTSSAATHNDIHSRLSKYGTILDIRKLPRRSGFLVDFLVPAAAAECVANYQLKNRDLARWATPTALRQAPAPRSQWRRPHKDTATAITTTTASTAIPAPDALEQPPGPPHEASVLFTGVRPLTSTSTIETLLCYFGPIQAVTIVPGKAEAVVSFVAHESAVHCLGKFRHRRHTVQHVPLALHHLCQPDRYPARPIDCRPMC